MNGCHCGEQGLAGRQLDAQCVVPQNAPSYRHLRRHLHRNGSTSPVLSPRVAGSLGFFIFRSRTTAYYFCNDVQYGGCGTAVSVVCSSGSRGGTVKCSLAGLGGRDAVLGA